MTRVLAVAALVALALTGCGDKPPPTPSPDAGDTKIFDKSGEQPRPKKDDPKGPPQ